MNSPELIEELQHSDRWLDDTYKDSNYYREYLKNIYELLIEKTRTHEQK